MTDMHIPKAAESSGTINPTPVDTQKSLVLHTKNSKCLHLSYCTRNMEWERQKIFNELFD